MKAQQCPGCQEHGQFGFLCKKCGRCEECCDCAGLFDADELGLDPETDNTPNHQERAA